MTNKREVILYFPWEMEYIVIPFSQLEDMICSNANKKVVIFNPEEHGTFNYELMDARPAIEELCKEHNVTLEFWLGDFGFNELESSHIKFINWPLFLLYSTVTTTDAIYQDEKSIDRLGITLNNIGHDYRCQFIDTLEKYKLLDEMYYSWHNEGVPSEFEFKYFQPRVVRLEEDDLNIPEGWNQYHVPKAFHKGLIHIINESTVDKLDISEKTWSCVIHKKPFIIAGATNIHSVLKELGFKLYEDLFDYSFDANEDYNQRLESIAMQVKALQGKDYQAVYNSQLETIEFNYNRLMEIFNNNIGVPDQLYDYINQTNYTTAPIYQAVLDNKKKME
jgi:hypothetical protein|tara:strand:+ start:753 stop:1754 length:1002 start_codon:yes stop_codon:yes gene_type:complete